jgi:hypothetical protein
MLVNNRLPKKATKKTPIFCAREIGIYGPARQVQGEY